MGKHCPEGLRQACDHGALRDFFSVSNQLPSGRERPPGAAGSEGELLALVWGGQSRWSGGDLTLSCLFSFRGILGNAGFWGIPAALGSR